MKVINLTKNILINPFLLFFEFPYIILNNSFINKELTFQSNIEVETYMIKVHVIYSHYTPN